MGRNVKGKKSIEWEKNSWNSKAFGMEQSVAARLGGFLIPRGYRDVETNFNISVKAKKFFELTMTTTMVINLLETKA